MWFGRISVLVKWTIFTSLVDLFFVLVHMVDYIEVLNISSILLDFKTVGFNRNLQFCVTNGWVSELVNGQCISCGSSVVDVMHCVCMMQFS